MSLRCLLSLLLLIGLVLAPVGMADGSSAIAMGSQDMAGMNHDQATGSTMPSCHDKQTRSEEDSPGGKQMPDNCCVMMCVAIPAIGGRLAARMAPAQIHQTPPPAAGPHGLEPEADPPPPRFS